MNSRSLLFVLLPSLLSVPALNAADIYLVRHAEKVLDGSHDPALTSTGEQRAANLAVVLRSAGIERILSSDYERTRTTATPLATQLGLEVEIYNPKTLHPLARRLLAFEQNALVVGHSNTTPELAELMGGDGGSPIVEDWEYDRLYLLQTKDGNVIRTILLHVPPQTSPPE